MKAQRRSERDGFCVYRVNIEMKLAWLAEGERPRLRWSLECETFVIGNCIEPRSQTKKKKLRASRSRYALVIHEPSGSMAQPVQQPLCFLFPLLTVLIISTACMQPDLGLARCSTPRQHRSSSFLGDFLSVSRLFSLCLHYNSAR